MAISKANGREYESRRDKGYRPQKQVHKPQRYPKGFDRWGLPNTCGVVDHITGKEGPERNFEYHRRCEFHQTLHEEELKRMGHLRQDEGPQ